MANGKSHGGRPLGHKLTDEQKEKISEALKDSEAFKQARDRNIDAQIGNRRPYWFSMRLMMARTGINQKEARKRIIERLGQEGVDRQDELKRLVKTNSCPRCGARRVEITTLSADMESGTAVCRGCTMRHHWVLEDEGATLL